jgi:membrane protein YqaA with SNARE-associated domain
MALILGERRKAFWYGCVCTAGSLLGAVLGYVIGWKLWQAVDEFFFAYIIDRADFVKVCQAYQEHLFLAVFTAAFTFIPFKVFTIASGVAAGGNWQAFGLFMLASLLGRGVRFFGVSGLMYLFGPRMKALIEKYFNLLCLILLLLLVLGFLLVKWLS